ncbi:glycosyltransferase family 4 protein [Bacteroidota bacterium]
MNHILRGQLRYMKQWYEVIGVSSYVEKDIRDIQEREEISLELIHMERKIAPIQDMLSLFKLIALFIRLKPGIVHTHTPKAGLLGMLAAWLTRVPVRLHTVAGLPLMESKGVSRKLLLGIEKLTYTLANRVYPNSKGLMDFILQEQICERKKLKVLGNGSSNGININHFTPDFTSDSLKLREDFRKTASFDETCLVFLFLGRIASPKGIEELLIAFRQIHSQYPETRLLLIGPMEKENGALKAELVREIDEHPAIHYPGRAEDIRPCLLASDIFVFPSYREGFPGVLLQAGAMGMPVIASDINGNNELIQDGANGLLVPAKNSQLLIAAMEKYILDPALRKLHAKALQDKVRNNYRNEVIWEALHNEYQGFLGK